MEKKTPECDSHVKVTEKGLGESLSIAHWILGVNAGVSTSNLKYFLSPIAKEYSDGKLKKTLNRELKESET